MKTITFLEKFTQFSQQHNLLQSGDRVVIAVSGGVDSMVLTDLLVKYSAQFSLEITAAHFNHQLRGDEADEDEAFVKSFCRQRGLPCQVGREDVPSFSLTHKMSIEMAARECRYKFLKRIAAENHGNKIATGHTANDQVETILDHFMRGSGVRGLCGMPPSQDMIIRPLLFAARADIERYAAENDLPYRTDSSNADTRYKRNRIRHMLLPMLQRQFNPKINTAVRRLGAVMSEIDLYLYQQAQNALQHCIKHKTGTKIILDIHQYLAYFNIIQKYMLFCALAELVPDVRHAAFSSLDRLDSLLERRAAGKYLVISKDFNLYIGQNELVILLATDKPKILHVDRLSGVYQLWENYSIEIKREQKTLSEIKSNQNPNIAWIDADFVQTPVVIRTIKPGDFFYPLNFTGSKKVSDFFIDGKIPVYERDSIPILEVQNSIAWIGGYRLDNRFKVTDSTKNILSFTLRQNP